MKEMFLLKYGEIALKGANRASFESVLMKNIRRRLRPSIEGLRHLGHEPQCRGGKVL